MKFRAASLLGDELRNIRCAHLGRPALVEADLFHNTACEFEVGIRKLCLECYKETEDLVEDDCRHVLTQPKKRANENHLIEPAKKR